jgi:hypothetical protein
VLGSCNAGFTCVDFLGNDLPRCSDCASAALYICRSSTLRCIDDPVTGPQCVP